MAVWARRSLGVEEQFYLLFPLLALGAYGRRVVATAPLTLPRWRSPEIIIAGSAIASFIACWILSRLHFDLAFYLMPSRLWQLTTGALLFEWQVRNRLE